MTNAEPADEQRPKIVQEAVRLVDYAEESGVPLRLVGGIAIRLRCADAPAQLDRSYADIDLVTNRKGGRQAMAVLEALGYVANERVNMMGDGSRLQALHPGEGEQVDVFVGEFRMCHAIPLEARLTLEPRTLPLAELLLTKLQVVELNAKDVTDIGMLVGTHNVGNGDGNLINANRIASILSDDWGLWRTVSDAVQTVPLQLRRLGVSSPLCDRVEERLGRLWSATSEAPKTRRWRMRARIGERHRWYDEPEEVQR